LRNEAREHFVNGKKVIKRTNAHIATVGMLFFDCIELRDDMREFHLKERTLSDMVEAYNKCQGQPGITFKVNKPWVKAWMTVAGGIISSAVKSKVVASATDYVATYEAPKVPFAGILLDVSSPRLYEPLAFHTGVLYQKSKFYGYGLYDGPGVTVRNYVTVEAQSVKIPIGVRYTFPKRKITAFLNAGAAFTLNVRPRGSAVHEREINNVVETFYRDDFAMPRSHLAYWGGAGGIIKLPYRFDGVVELRYEKSSNVIMAHLLSNITTFQLVLGVRTK
jgi:hypothetical protein